MQDTNLSILLIEDEPRVADFVSEALQEFDYEVTWVATGQQGLDLILTNTFAIAILDIMLPDIDGFTVLSKAREARCGTPILMLSARSDVDDKVRGLDYGADDYLAKPFELKELIARVRVLLRRPQSNLDALTISDLTLEPLTRRVTRGDRSVDLTAREFSLLELLLRKRGKVVSRAEIMEMVWGDPEADHNVIPVYINYLRAKIEPSGSTQLIHTARGVGYILDARDQSAP